MLVDFIENISDDELKKSQWLYSDLMKKIDKLVVLKLLQQFPSTAA